MQKHSRPGIFRIWVGDGYMSSTGDGDKNQNGLNQDNRLLVRASGKNAGAHMLY